MNKEIADKWVAALRSGDYVQGRGMLNNRGKFCCLGVLCDIIVSDGHWGDYSYVDAGGDKWSYLPPLGVTEAAGLQSRDGEIPERYEEDGEAFPTTLAHMNDHLRLNFEEIADKIEQYWQVL